MRDKEHLETTISSPLDALMDYQATTDSYLEAEIRTATPQKRRLLLIESALKFANKTKHQWENEETEEGIQTVIRCRGILSELLMSIREEHSPLTKRVSAIYYFLFKTSTEAQLHRSLSKLDDVIRILEIERKTWEMLCEQMPDFPEDELGAFEPEVEITAEDMEAIPVSDQPESTGFSLDA